MPRPLIALLTPALALAVDYPVQPVPFTRVHLTGGLLAERQAVDLAVTIPFALQQCEDSHRLANFDQAAEVLRRRAAGDAGFQLKPLTKYPFDDTDPYKAIEAASYALAAHPDDALVARLEAMIVRIGAAQEADGYLYTFRTMHPDTPAHAWIGQQRWEKDHDLSHELYNLGHLYEAATAYHAATGKRSLLDIALRTAELLWRDFAPGKPIVVPGHQVIEMGLVHLYRATGDARWLTLAQRFLEARGHGRDYSQDHQPVLDQRAAVGHAVRANYLYAGMADVAALTGDARYRTAITALWDDVVQRKYYLTGGLGARARGEAYGAAYELPHDAYNETCAAVAFVMWSHRMYLLSGEARYYDGLERTLFNGTLSGISLSGDRFFYPNPLIYDGKAVNNHEHAGRAPWFGCACCPPNIARLLASLGGYVAAVQGDRLDVGLYTACTVEATVAGTAVRLTQDTAYPANGRVALTVAVDQPTRFTLSLRLPGWAQGRPVPGSLYTYADATAAGWSLTIDGQRQEVIPQDGWLRVERTWGPTTRVDLDLPMPVRVVRGAPEIPATRGEVAFERGPIVYAVEGIDQPGRALESPVRTDVAVTEAPAPTGLPAALPALRVPTADGGALMAIPYFAWNNRGLSPMRVWLKTAP